MEAADFFNWIRILFICSRRNNLSQNKMLNKYISRPWFSQDQTSFTETYMFVVRLFDKYIWTWGSNPLRLLQNQIQSRYKKDIKIQTEAKQAITFHLKECTGFCYGHKMFLLQLNPDLSVTLRHQMIKTCQDQEHFQNLYMSRGDLQTADV